MRSFWMRCPIFSCNLKGSRKFENYLIRFNYTWSFPCWSNAHNLCSNHLPNLPMSPQYPVVRQTIWSVKWSVFRSVRQSAWVRGKSGDLGLELFPPHTYQWYRYLSDSLSMIGRPNILWCDRLGIFLLLWSYPCWFGTQWEQTLASSLPTLAPSPSWWNPCRNRN